MLGSIGRRKGKQEERRLPGAEAFEQNQLESLANKPLFSKLSLNESFIMNELGDSKDIQIRYVCLNDPAHTPAMLVYVQGMVDDERLNRYVIQPMQEVSDYTAKSGENLFPPAMKKGAGEIISGDSLLRVLQFHLVSVGMVEKVTDWEEFFERLLLGFCLIFVEGKHEALASHVIGGSRRGVEEPKTAMLIRGPREGFVESISTNTAMVRRKLRTQRLWMEDWQIGQLTQTPVAVMYIKGLADENVLQDLRSRLDKIDIDGILESGYIEELISDQPWTPFPTMLNSERPDVVAANLLEGRIAIMVDGTPFALLLPADLNAFFQSPEDYYQNYDIGSFIRVLRIFSFAISLMLPSFYVAIIGFHQEMIPTEMLLKLAVQREGIPFPAYLEAFIMEFVFEILREAVVRMPSAAGNTISIVGGLVIGQSVVEAGIVSPAAVIVVAFTAITSFVSPSYGLGITARLLRFALLLAASTLGFYGIGIVLLVVLLHVSNLRSFGEPYLKPFAPFFLSDMKDTFIRAPFKKMIKRPHDEHALDKGEYDERQDPITTQRKEPLQ